MRDSNIGNQSAYWNEENPEFGEVLGYRTSISEIFNILRDYNNLQYIDEHAISGFIFDLSQIINGASALSESAAIFFRGKNTFCEIIRSAIYDLHTALQTLKQVSNRYDATVMRQFYDCLNECQTHLEMALQRLAIDTS